MIIRFNEIRLIPNILSSFRLLLIIPLIYIFNNINNPSTRNNYLLLIILIAFISDILDGFIARKFKLISDLGKIIDPLADKIVVATIVIYFWKLNLIPTYYFLIIMLRDFFILIGSFYLTQRTKKILMSDIIGKLTVLTIGLFFITILFNYDKNFFVYNLFMSLSILMSFVSLINYTYKSLNILLKD